MESRNLNYEDLVCINVKKQLRKLKKEKNWTIPKMAEINLISEGYLGNLLSLKSQKVPTINLLAQITKLSGVHDIKVFFEPIEDIIDDEVDSLDITDIDE